MSKTVDILSIGEIREIVSRVCSAYPVMKAYLFGSAAREQQSMASDIDLMIELLPDSPSDGLTLGGLYCDLEEALGKPVDIITTRPQYLAVSKPRLFEHIKRDRILIYER